MKLSTPTVAFESGDDIASIVRKWARETPKSPALIQGGTVTTWAAFDARVDRAASALTSRGIRKGERIAVLAQNSIEYVEVFFGGLRAGASVVPLPTMASAASLSLMLADCRAKILFASEQYRRLAESLDAHGVTHRIGFDFEAGDFVSYATYMGAAPAGAAALAVSGDDEFDVLYSSGT